MTFAYGERWANPGVILVATDLLDLEHLMAFAVPQARECRARLLLLHVIPVTNGFASDPAGRPCYDPASAVECASKVLHPWVSLARDAGIECHALIREGIPVQQINAAVRQFHVDRILIGTRRRGKLTRLLLGSVAEQVLRSVPLPVITVGPEAHLPVSGSHDKQVVLHATKLREASRPSAVLACRIAAAQNTRLVLLHVLPPQGELTRRGLPSSIDSATLSELRTLAGESNAECGLDVPIESRVAHGNPSIEILASAAALSASLIILGASRHSTMQSLTRDHTIYRVLAHARCPVLTLHEDNIVSTENGDLESAEFQL
jgi:nucleotide-binding universal stress UspA family protein